MNIWTNDGAIDTSLFAFFNVFIFSIGSQKSVDAFPGLGGNGLDIFAKSGFFEAFINQTNATKISVGSWINKMKSKSLITEAFRLFDDRGTKDLFSSQCPFGKRAWIGPKILLEWVI